MRKPLKFLLLTSLSITLPYGAYGMKEETPPPTASVIEPQESSEVPSGYVHKKPIDQIKDYREAFNTVWEEKPNEELLPFEHVPGLFPILKNGFALVNDCISKKNEDSLIDKEIEPFLESTNFFDIWKIMEKTKGTKISEKEVLALWSKIEPIIIRKELKKNLDELWGITKEINKKQRLSSAVSQCINMILARIVGKYKNERISPDSYPDSNIEKMKNALDSIKNEDTGKDFFSKIGDPSSDLHYGCVVFIIYANPDPNIRQRGILPERFVDQYCHEGYSAYLALFDVLSEQRTKGTKKEAHYSSVNGTARMLEHDYAHISGEVSITKWEMKFPDFPFRGYIKQIYKIKEKLDKEEKYNEAKIISNGIFLLFHEILASVSFQATKAGKKSISEDLKNNNEFGAFAMIVKEANGRMDEILHKRPVGSYEYKADPRDWEYNLKNVHDLDKKPFLPIVRVSKEKERPFPIARDEGGKIIVVTQETPTEGLTYLSKEELGKDLPEIKEAIDERNRLLTISLKDGYKRFWATFLKIIEENQKYMVTQEK